jgi:hypothetical protein
MYATRTDRVLLLDQFLATRVFDPSKKDLIELICVGHDSPMVSSDFFASDRSFHILSKCNVSEKWESNGILRTSDEEDRAFEFIG